MGIVPEFLKDLFGKKTIPADPPASEIPPTVAPAEPVPASTLDPTPGPTPSFTPDVVSSPNSADVNPTPTSLPEEKAA